MPKIKIRDISLYYEMFGAGPPVVLIMGWSGNVRWWPQEFIQVLARHFQVIIFDNRGSGRSCHASNGRPYTIPLLAEDTINLMDGLDIRQPHILGLSMGGMIAQELSLRFPHRIDRLILACTFSQPSINNFVSSNTLKIIPRYLLDPRARRRTVMTNLVFEHRFLQSLSPERFARIQEAIDSQGMSHGAKMKQIRAILRFSSDRRLEELQAPTLVLAGDRDSLINPNASKNLAQKIPNASLKLLAGRGHGFIFEEPNESGIIARDFFLGV